MVNALEVKIRLIDLIDMPVGNERSVHSLRYSLARIVLRGDMKYHGLEGLESEVFTIHCPRQSMPRVQQLQRSLERKSEAQRHTVHALIEHQNEMLTPFYNVPVSQIRMFRLKGKLRRSDTIQCGDQFRWRSGDCGVGF